MNKRVIRIGTRESELAMWQAHYVKDSLEANNHICEIIPITSDGEIETIKPIYEIGVTGVFTKTLDMALLAEEIDIAVHSLKDVPTQLPTGIVLAAVPPRGDHRDAIVTREAIANWSGIDAVIATSSVRRKAQWIHRYSNHNTENIRGNINTRLTKVVETEHWSGAIFAAVGIERINLKVPSMEILDWMLPAPAQGALGIVCRESDSYVSTICKTLNDTKSKLAVDTERMFLRGLMGGCATPIACHVQVDSKGIHLHGNILSLGNTPIKKEIKKSYDLSFGSSVGLIAAQELLNNGGKIILDENNSWK